MITRHGFTFLLALSCFAISVVCNTNSGIKLSLNADYAKLLQNLDISLFVKDKVVLSPPGIDTDSLLYSVHVDKVVIKNVKTPEDIQVINTPAKKNSNGTTKVVMRTMNILLNVDFSISFMTIKDNNTDSPVEIIIDRIEGEYTFTDGQVDFKNLKIVLKDIKIQFQSQFYDVIYGIFKRLIISQINSASPKIQKKIEDSLNKFINDQNVLKVPQVPIYANVTSTDKPELYFTEAKKSGFMSEKINYTPKRALLETETDELVYQAFKTIMTTIFEIPEEEVVPNNGDFLAEEVAQELILLGKAPKPVPVIYDAFVRFGIDGTLFSDEKEKIIVDPSVHMDFTENFNDYGINVLLSDYTISSVFKILQLSGFLLQNYDSNMSGLPFSIDSQGLSSILPQLSKKYDSPKNCLLDIGVPIYDVDQPIIKTVNGKITATYQFIFDLKVQEDDDPFIDPVEVFSSLNTLTVEIDASFVDEKLTIFVHNYEVTDISIRLSELDDKLDEEIYRKNVVKFAEYIFSKKNDQLKNIDINGLIQSKGLPFELSKFTLEKKERYNSLAFNISRK